MAKKKKIAHVDTSEILAEDDVEASEIVAKDSVVASEIVAEHNVDASGNVSNVDASAVVAKDLPRMTIAGPEETEVEEAVLPLYTFLENASTFPNAEPLAQSQFDVCADYAEALLALPQTCKAAPIWLELPIVCPMRMALIMTFSKDLPGLVQNSSNILKMTDPEQEKNLKALEAEIALFVEKEKLRWMIVCDQHNALFSEPVTESKLPSSLFIRLSFCATIIISASANNEGFVKRDESWIEYDIGIRRFEENELSVWCGRYFPPISQDLQTQVLEATGGIPLELDLFRNSVGATLEQKFENYVTSRQSDVVRIHANYFDKLSPGRKESFTELLASMSLDVAAPTNTIGMDRKFMEVVEKDGVRKVVAMTQLYERALYGYHGRLRREWADKFASHILSAADK